MSRRVPLVRRSVLHRMGSYLGVLLACATACAVIAGALLVGDSVRGSLADRALERLGPFRFGITAARPVRAKLADDLEASLRSRGRPEAVVPILLVSGGAVHAEKRTRDRDVQIAGIGPSFPLLAGAALQGEEAWRPRDRGAAINASLAREIGAEVGDELLVYISKPDDVPRETVLGRREETFERLRVDVERILPDAGLGLFDLRNQQSTPHNIFVDIERLGRSLDVPNRANVLLIGGDREAPRGERSLELEEIDAALRASWRLEDFRLVLRTDDERGYASLESEEFLFPGSFVGPAIAAASKERAAALEVFTYLVKTIAVDSHSIPYAIVTALSPWRLPDGSTDPSLAPPVADPPRIILHDHAARRLDAQPGDEVELEYWVVGTAGGLEERKAMFQLERTVPLAGAVADPGWTPYYEGMSDAETLGSWDVPFPIDNDRIRAAGDEYEKYWDEHKTTPRAFIALEDGERLWSNRFGSRTAIRLRPLSGAELAPLSGIDLTSLKEGLTRDFLASLSPDVAGLRIDAVRSQALEAARSGTDFAGLFLALSSFIIISALILVSMSYRLALERRTREFGMLRAVGFSERALRRLLFAEAAWIATIGAVLGIAGGVLYAALLIAGLESWWEKAVNAPFLALHIEPLSLVIAFFATIILGGLTAFVVARRAAKLSPSHLLAGNPLTPTRATGSRSSGRVSGAAALILGLTGALLLVLASVDVLSRVLGFVGGGIALFCAFFAALSWILRRGTGGRLRGSGALALVRFGALSGRRAPGRSLLTAGLIGSASFVVVAVASSHRTFEDRVPSLDSGDGGFALVARSAAPLHLSLASEDGREGLVLRDETKKLLLRPRTRVFGFRERPGDETSCLNLYRPQTPRILGVPPDFIARGGFAWSGSAGETPADEENPWRLLEDSQSLPAGVVPAIGDENTVLWILHAGLGDDIVVEDESGGEVHLRIVGLLSRSILQGALIVSEKNFERMFPRRTGRSTFLIEADPEIVPDLVRGLEADLEPYGFDATTTGAVLAAFASVENTYLETFFVLGGLGLVLGTLGLGAALLRGVLERRGELALLRAVGFARRDVGFIVLSEGLSLLAGGVLIGAACAVVATYPARSGSEGPPWTWIGGALLATLAAGALSSLFALRAALRQDLITSLREE